ncbi:MAG TPA: hypothetical protein VMM56_03390, partial [Planctomycetaceae bacterium]|nr:hypothetical protein [Planctomycetaceae bacterium]
EAPASDLSSCAASSAISSLTEQKTMEIVVTNRRIIFQPCAVPLTGVREKRISLSPLSTPPLATESAKEE